MTKELDDLGPLPRIHPREARCEKAQFDLEVAIEKIRVEHKLTYAEILRVVWRAADRFVSRYIQIAIRLERHGDSDKPGGIE